MAEEAIQIPVCRRCRARKIRCDHAAPKCTGCSKSNAACIIVDTATGTEYTRAFVHDLEEREKQLLEATRNRTLSTVNEDPSRRLESPRDAPSAESRTTFGGYVGENSGSSMLQSVYDSIGSNKPSALHDSATRPQIPELTLSANDYPPLEEAVELLENYFRRFHTNHTFLVREEIMEAFHKVYRSSSPGDCSAQVRFRIFLIFAIGGITRHRAGLTQEHPFGYYLAAMASLDSVPLIGSPDAIQNSLLIARFGMYHHIGTSLWDISHFCMRQCIELGYHAPPRSPISLIEEQKRRRIFWECYILDRYSSGMLGRPFALSDDSISVELPVLADDETVRAAAEETTLSDLSALSMGKTTEVSVFVMCIQLRRVSSSVHTELSKFRMQQSCSAQSNAASFTSAGHVQTLVHHYLAELDLWRQNAPVFNPPGSLYERPEYHDFLLEKDKLNLIRGAMHIAPKHSNGSPPPDLLALCLPSAVRVIALYHGMLVKRQITWTRSYFQGIFTAGLSVLFCLSLNPATTSPGDIGPTHALVLCSQILHMFQKEMPDVQSFGKVFDELMDLLNRKLQAPVDRGLQPPPTVPGGCRNIVQPDIENGPQWMGYSAERPMFYDAVRDSGTQAAPGLEFSDLEFTLESLGEDGIEWPLHNEEFMESLTAGLGEYAWGFGGDDTHLWDQFDFA